jgi:hypothetical protein
MAPDDDFSRRDRLRSRLLLHRLRAVMRDGDNDAARNVFEELATITARYEAAYERAYVVERLIGEGARGRDPGRCHDLDYEVGAVMAMHPGMTGDEAVNVLCELGDLDLLSF